MSTDGSMFRIIKADYDENGVRILKKIELLSVDWNQYYIYDRPSISIPTDTDEQIRERMRNG